MVKAQVKTFDFAKLKKYSSRYLEIVNALLRKFPQLSRDEGEPSLFSDIFEKDLGLKIKLTFSGLEERTFEHFIDALPSPCVSVLLRLEPGEQTMVMDLDLPLVRFLLDRLLGGESPSDLNSLSPLEEGVLDYLLLKVVQAVGEAPTLLGPNAVRILKVVSEPKMLSDAIAHDESGCVLKFFLGTPGQGGYIRIYLPHPLVEGVLLQEDVVEGVIPPGEEDRLETLLDRVSHIKTTVVTEVGRVRLSASEKSHIEKGDVILFDETFATMGPHGVHGKTVLRVGDASGAGWLAEIIDSEGKVVLKVLDFYGD